MITLNIIGAGAVGQTLGHLCVKQHQAKILGVVNQSLLSAHAAIQFMEQGQAYTAINQLPHADMTMITTTDAQLPHVVSQLTNHRYLKPGAIVLHCSGTLHSGDMAALRERGLHVASIHPMMSFKQPQNSVAQFQNIPCALEGDAEALEDITALFTAIGGSVYPIQKDKKVLYHIAGVFASNYQITMAQQAFECFIAAGLPPQRAQQLLYSMMQTMSHNVANAVEPKAALTGPLQRGDSAIIQEHLRALQDPELQSLYRKVGRATVRLTELNAEAREALLNIL